MQLHEMHRREAVSALARAQREAEENIHRATCHTRFPDDVLGCLTGPQTMTEMGPQDHAVAESSTVTITTRRQRFSFWRRSVRRFPG